MPRLTSFLHAVCLCFLTVLLSWACTPAWCLQPTPDAWQQSQPQTDVPDPRLSQNVSLDEPHIQLAPLLAELSEMTGVQFLPADDIRNLPLTVIAQRQNLPGLLSCLAQVTDAYWFFPRGATPSERRYCLARGSRALTLGEILDRELRQREDALNVPFVEARRQRLQDYAAALKLSPDEVLARYEESDPWLCSTILSPLLRPMIDEICGLSQDRQAQLHREGRLAFRMSEIDEDFRRHLADYASGRWGPPHAGTPLPDPDALPLFATAAERWRQSTVVFRWHLYGLQVQVWIPEQGSVFVDPMRLKNDTPRNARLRLVSLGYRKDTPEYRRRVLAEAHRWDEEHADSTDDMVFASLCETPNITDPRLDLSVNLQDLEDDSLSAFLCRFAQDHHVPIVAAWIPPRIASTRPVRKTQSAALGHVLQSLRRRRGGRLSWDFRGAYLLVKDAELSFLTAGRLPEALLNELNETLTPGRKVPLSDIALVLGRLNAAQIETLMQVSPLVDQFPVQELRAYGSLSPGQRSQLGQTEGLAFSSLTADQQRAIFTSAELGRPWLSREDLHGAALRTIPRRLASGRDGISFLVQYESPGDRQVVFTLPLQLAVE